MQLENQYFSQQLMIEKKKTEAKDTRRTWLPYAVGSAIFAALTSILAKIGISGVESNLGTAIRTGVVLVMSWVIVLIKGKGTELKKLDRKELHELIRQHYLYTGSNLARTLLDDWTRSADDFIKVIPIEYKHVLEQERLRGLAEKVQNLQIQY